MIELDGERWVEGFDCWQSHLIRATIAKEFSDWNGNEPPVQLCGFCGKQLQDCKFRISHEMQLTLLNEGDL